MRAGCVTESRCEYCPVRLIVNDDVRNVVADQVDTLVHAGYGVDGVELGAKKIAELTVEQARRDGDREDVGIVAGAMVLVASGQCNKVWS